MNAYFQFTSKKEIRKVALKEIMYFSSSDRVISVHLTNGTVERFYGKLDGVEKELKENNKRFLRIHQSYLVNYDHVCRLRYTKIFLAGDDGKEIELEISERRMKAVHLAGIVALVFMVIQKHMNKRYALKFAR